MRIPFAFATLALLAALPALAQSDSGESQDPPKRVTYAKEETITFGEVEIRGERKKPAGMLITGHHEDAFASMIDERVHFKRELAKSAGFGIKRSTAGETVPK